MKDLITETLYDPETKCIDFNQASKPEVYDEIFYNALKDTLVNEKLKIRHIICTSSLEFLLKLPQAQNIVSALASSLPKATVVNTMDFTGNEKLTPGLARNIGKLIKWRKGGEKVISEGLAQILVLDGMKVSREDILSCLWGKKINQPAKVNYIKGK